MTTTAASPARPDTGAKPRVKGITFQPDIYPVVLRHMPADRSARVLDVGAGEGYFCQLLQERGYTNIEACDFLEEPFGLPDVPFHQADLNERLPIEDASVDCVVSIEVAEHIENHFRFMSECMRVLKPGGTLIVTTPNILSLPGRFHFLLYGYTDCAPRPLDPHRPDYFMQHINPISVPELLFHIERGGGELVALDTNRYRKGAWAPMALYPFLKLAIRGKLLRPKQYAAHIERYRTHAKWVTHPANLMGRITIAVARKRG